MSENETKKKRLSRENLSKASSIVSYLRPYRVSFGLGMLILFLSSITTLIVPRLMGQLAGIGIGDSTTEWKIDIGSLQLDMMDLSTVAIVLFAVFLVQGVISFLKIYVFSYVTEHMMKDLRSDLYSRMIRLPMSYFADKKVGELNSRISADIAAIQETFTTTLAEFIRQIIVIVLGVAFLYYTSPQLTWVMLLTLPVMMIVAVFFGRFIRKLSKRTQDLIADSNVIVQETLMGIVNVKSFTNESYEAKRYDNNVIEVRKIALKSSIWRGFFGAFIIIFLFGSIGVVIWRGAQLMQSGDLDVGLFFSFLLYTVMIGASFGGIATQYSALQRALGSIESVLDLLEQPIENVAMLHDKSVSTRLDGSVEFKSVSFSYPSRADVAVLKQLSFKIEAGQQVALVGPSGAGKSTIASLILSFYKPDQGSILYDDKSASEFDLTYLRSQMAYVPQEVLLFGGTIKENIAYGRPSALDNEIFQAAERAQAMEFINGFSDGVETLVGDRGIQLSGGQKQRIAIARALLKDPAILILDEATSSLDSSSESLVQGALDTLMKGRTSIVIAHRLSTIRKADKILVLQNGQLNEFGTHEQLIANDDGLYRQLSELQFQGQDYLT